MLSRLEHPTSADFKDLRALSAATGTPLQSSVVDKCADREGRLQMLELCARAKAKQGDFRGASDDFSAVLKVDSWRYWNGWAVTSLSAG